MGVEPVSISELAAAADGGFHRQLTSMSRPLAPTLTAPRLPTHRAAVGAPQHAGTASHGLPLVGGGDQPVAVPALRRREPHRGCGARHSALPTHCSRQVLLPAPIPAYWPCQAGRIQQSTGAARVHAASLIAPPTPARHRSTLTRFRSHPSTGGGLVIACDAAGRQPGRRDGPGIGLLLGLLRPGGRR